MKKIISVILATVMLFAVCTMSVFAISISTNDGTTNPNVGSLHYVDTIEAKGKLNFSPSNRYLDYTVSCKNINHDELYDYHLYAQCAINYSDESQDFYTVTNQLLIGHNTERTIRGDAVLPSNKTVVGFDAEFFVWYNHNTLWEGYIYETYTVGINA